MSDDLKPCPFCKGEASKTPDPSHSTGWEVGCFSGKCDVEPHVWAVHLETAVMQWNTRSDADRIEQLERENARLDAGWTDANARALAARLEVIKAVEALRPFADVLKGNYFHQPDTMPISMGFGEYDRRLALKLMDFRNARTVLAELEGMPT